MSHEGQVIAVTGAASGIGLTTAGRLAAGGAKVALIDLDEATLAAAAGNLAAAGRNVLAIPADIADAAAMEAAMTRVVQRFERLDGFVANAGVRMQSTPIVDLDDAVWDRVVRVNLRGPFVSCRAAARAMRGNTAGAMVLVASISGHAVRLGQSAYCASKAGVIRFSAVLALELAEHGIRVNSVCPGTVNTAMFKLAQAQDRGAKELEERIHGSLARMRAGIPLRRIAEPEDVAAAVRFLLSADARHITGQALFVDGGESVV